MHRFDAALCRLDDRNAAETEPFADLTERLSHIGMECGALEQTPHVPLELARPAQH